MPLVSKPISFACRAERLTGARACPNALIVSPSRPPQSEGPYPDSGKEMTLRKSSNIVWSHIFNTPFVNNSGRDMPRFNQVSQPLRRVGINLVIVCRHIPSGPVAKAASPPHELIRLIQFNCATSRSVPVYCQPGDFISRDTKIP